MKRITKALLKISAPAFFLACASVFVFAHEPRVSGELDKREAYVGDAVKYKIKAELPQKAYVLSDKKIVFNNFDTLSVSATHVSERPNVYEIVFELAAYETGSFDIEPVGLYYIDGAGRRKMFFTPPEKVTVASVLDGRQKDIADIKPLKSAGINKKNIALAVLFFLFMAATAVSVFKEAAAKRAVKTGESDPRSMAMLRLDALLRSGAFENGDTRLFYYRAAEILRKYISIKCNFNAMEMTSAELLKKFEKENYVSMTKNELKEYFYIFDLARYAGLKATRLEMTESLEKTKEFITKL